MLRFVFTPTPWERREGSVGTTPEREALFVFTPHHGRFGGVFTPTPWARGVSNFKVTHGSSKRKHAEQQSMHAAARS
jgi:hypothetical protein